MIHGSPASARAALAAWYEAGADQPLVTLVPGAPAELLRETIEALAPD